MDTCKSKKYDGVYQAPSRFIEEQGEVFVTQVTGDSAARVPTEELGHIYGSQSKVSESYASDDVYAIQTNRNRRQPAWAQPTQQQRPGWVTYRNEPTDVCFECLGLGHKKPNCPHLSKTYFDPQFREMVKKNYHALTPQQKDYLQAVGRTTAFAFKSNPRQEALYPPAPSMPSVPSTLSSEAGSYQCCAGM